CFYSQSDASAPGSRPDLRTATDASAWLEDYRKADERGREALLTRWLAQERSYAVLLHRCPPWDRPAAQELLADLWGRGRLAPAHRAAIVRELVSMRIVERAAWDAVRGHRELQVQAERRFPFPKGTWLQWSCTLDIGDRPLQLDTNCWSTRDWEGAG